MTASQRRRASWQWLWSVDAWFPALAAVLLVGVLGTLFLSGGLRVLCAVVLGVSATYFATLLVGLRRVRVDQQVRVTLDDDGIAWSTPLAESRAAWRSVQRLDLTRDFAFARAPGATVYMPRSELSGEALRYLVARTVQAGGLVRGAERELGVPVDKVAG